MLTAPRLVDMESSQALIARKDFLVLTYQNKMSCAASHPFPLYVSSLSLAKLFLKLPGRTTSIPLRDSVVSKECK